MSPKKILKRLQNFSLALERLQESIHENPAISSTILDGTVKRFEFTFELSWKLMKDYLDYKGIEAATPRDVIKEAYQAKLISNGDQWIQMLEDRNTTSHVYDEEEIRKIYNNIKNIHFPQLKIFQHTISKLASELN